MSSSKKYSFQASALLASTLELIRFDPAGVSFRVEGRLARHGAYSHAHVHLVESAALADHAQRFDFVFRQVEHEIANDFGCGYRGRIRMIRVELVQHLRMALQTNDHLSQLRGGD